MKNRSSVMKKTTSFMKKSYETLNTTPIGVELTEAILASSITAAKAKVTVHPYEEGFAGAAGAETFDGKSFSDISF